MRIVFFRGVALWGANILILPIKGSVVMQPVHDVLGVGFGPSNLALAIAAKEWQEAGGQANLAFIERKPGFNWHEGMLIDGSTMQISFLKDLVTLRNPQSRFTFINYLKAQGRLEDFINIQTFFPTREEYNDYLSWAAGHFKEQVHYGQQVEAVTPWLEAGEVVGMVVSARQADGQVTQHHTRHLVMGLGGAPNIPAAFSGVTDPRVVHSSQYRGRIDTLLADRQRPLKVAVVGGGQSAAEIFEDLTLRFPNVEASMIVRASALKPSDDSPFVNEIFNPSFIDQIYTQSNSRRREMLTEFRNTNYAVVDLPLIERIYQMFYLQKLRQDPRHQMLAHHAVEQAVAQPEGVQLTLTDVLEARQYNAHFDVVILATGYRRDQHETLLAGMAEHLDTLTPDRDYSLRLRDSESRIYLQGCCEMSHGLSDTLLSVLAVRSQEIVEAIFEPSTQPRREAALA